MHELGKWVALFVWTWRELEKYWRAGHTEIEHFAVSRVTRMDTRDFLFVVNDSTLMGAEATPEELAFAAGYLKTGTVYFSR